MTHGTFVCTTLAIGLLLRAVPAVASPDDPSVGSPLSPEYREAAKLAVSEFELGNYAEARSRFMQAHELLPNARALRGLGKAEYELRNYSASIDYLERSLASRQRPLDDALRADVERLLHLAYGYVATYELELTPERSRVSVDGRPAVLRDDRTLVLEVGSRQLTVRADGYETRRIALEVVGRRREVLTVDLTPQAPPPLASATGTDHRTRWGGKQWGVFGSIAAVVVAGAVTGLALGLAEDRPEGPDGGNTGRDIYVQGGAGAR